MFFFCDHLHFIYIIYCSGACLNVSIAVTNSSNKETETTPLIQAITSKISAKLSLSLAQILLLHGADPDVVAGGRLPLLEAVKLDRLEVVRLLLESGVNKEVCDEKVNFYLQIQYFT